MERSPVNIWKTLFMSQYCFKWNNVTVVLLYVSWLPWPNREEWWWWIIMMMNCFCGMADHSWKPYFQKKPSQGSLTIVTFPRRGGKWSRIAETAICIAATTPRHRSLMSQVFRDIELKGNEVFCIRTSNFYLLEKILKCDCS